MFCRGGLVSTEIVSGRFLGPTLLWSPQIREWISRITTWPFQAKQPPPPPGISLQLCFLKMSKMYSFSCGIKTNFCTLKVVTNKVAPQVVEEKRGGTGCRGRCGEGSSARRHGAGKWIQKGQKCYPPISSTLSVQDSTVLWGFFEGFSLIFYL